MSQSDPRSQPNQAPCKPPVLPKARIGFRVPRWRFRLPLRSLFRPFAFVARPLTALGKAGLDMLLPAHCLACAQPTQVSSGLCASCFGSVAFIRPPLCQSCGKPLLVALDAAPLCPSCEEPLAVTALAQTRAVGLYRGALAELIKAYKHGDRLDLVPRLAQWMLAAGQELLQQGPHEDQPPLIVPIPLHWRHLLKRRYNQSGLLAQALASATGLPLCSDALIRKHFIASQKDQSADQRFANLYEAFSTRSKRLGALQGRRIILIDDVRTTGAILQSAGETLMQAGARQVCSATLPVTGARHRW